MPWGTCSAMLFLPSSSLRSRATTVTSGKAPMRKRQMRVVSAFGLTRWKSALRYGVNPVDPVTFGTVAVGLIGIVLLTSYLPATRASGMSPTEVLRAE